MRNKKGFTLIELLAVIVILAIIALIATPIVLGIIEDSRESSEINSAQFMIDGVQTAYAVAYTKSYEAEGDITAKSAGEVPTLQQIKSEIEFKSAKADIEKDNEGKDILVVKTGDTADALKCTFKLEENDKGEEALISDTCGFTEGEIEKTEIGPISGAQTAPADPTPADPEPGA